MKWSLTSVLLLVPHSPPFNFLAPPPLESVCKTLESISGRAVIEVHHNDFPMLLWWIPLLFSQSHWLFSDCDVEIYILFLLYFLHTSQIKCGQSSECFQQLTDGLCPFIPKKVICVSILLLDYDHPLQVSSKQFRASIFSSVFDFNVSQSAIAPSAPIQFPVNHSSWCVNEWFLAGIINVRPFR